MDAPNAGSGPPMRQQGKVKWFDAQKGWGFIQPLDGSEDIFVHQQSILAQGFRSLDDGEDVEFDTETDSQGRRRATQVSGPGGQAVRGSSRPMGFRGNNGGPGGNFGNRENWGIPNRGNYDDRRGPPMGGPQGGWNNQGGYGGGPRRNDGGYQSYQRGEY